MITLNAILNDIEEAKAKGRPSVCGDSVCSPRGYRNIKRSIKPTYPSAIFSLRRDKSFFGNPVYTMSYKINVDDPEKIEDIAQKIIDYLKKKNLTKYEYIDKIDKGYDINEWWYYGIANSLKEKGYSFTYDYKSKYWFSCGGDVTITVENLNK